MVNLSEERYIIICKSQAGESIRNIAKELNRSPSIICRELRRNQDPDGIYRHDHAQSRSRQRRVAGRKLYALHKEDKELIIELLKKDWSPEQICGRLRLKQEKKYSVATIYYWLKHDRKHGGKTYLLLRRKHRYQHNRKTAANHLRDRVMIDHRPEIVDKRERIGDWELDTIISGKGDNTVLITLVDRKSRFLIAHLSPNKKASTVAKGIIEMIRRNKLPVFTLTSDNGTEFSEHKMIASKLKTEFYFARAHHPWERGTNENTNGLLRQYIPTGTILKKARKIISEGIAKINNRPRKVLRYRTPAEFFLENLRCCA